MNYYFTKPKQEILDAIDSTVYNETHNMVANMMGQGAMEIGPVMESLREGIHMVVMAGFRELMNNSAPETEIDDILLDRDGQN